MSDGEHGETSNAQLLCKDFKEEQLEIVEVTQYEKDLKGLEEHVLVEGSENSGDGDLKYMQVLNPSKGMMVDLLNLTLVRSEDGQESYRLVSGAEAPDGGADTVCVLQPAALGDDKDSGETYVMVDGTQGPLVFLQAPVKKDQAVKPAPSPVQILEKAKFLQKAKCSSSGAASGSSGGRRRRGELPPPHELLASPNFKLFLYSCKLCSFRCNAIKELTAHKAAAHRGRARGGSRPAAVALQCARCPFRAASYCQLMKHVKEKHVTEDEDEADELHVTNLDSAEVDAADVLVCGACGFESGSKVDFKKHIEDEHGATTC